MNYRYSDSCMYWMEKIPKILRFISYETYKSFSKNHHNYYLIPSSLRLSLNNVDLYPTFMVYFGNIKLPRSLPRYFGFNSIERSGTSSVICYSVYLLAKPMLSLTIGLKVFVARPNPSTSPFWPLFSLIFKPYYIFLPRSSLTLCWPPVCMIFTRFLSR